MKLEYDHIVVGNCLTALANAYYGGYPILVQGRPSYYFFDHINDKQKSRVWREFAFQLTLAGLMPFGEKIKEIIPTDEAMYEVVTNDGKRHEVWYDSSETVSQSQGTHPKEYYEVIDWFNVTSGRVHTHDKLSFASRKFVNKILFYPTTRFLSHDKFKDLVAVSYAPKSEIDAGGIDPVFVRFEVVDCMLAAGIKGSKNGFNEDKKQKYIAVNIEHERRDIRPCCHPEFADIELVRAANMSHGGNFTTNSGDKEINKLMEKFGGPLA